MEISQYESMASNLDALAAAGGLEKKSIYLFGHCNATEKLAELLLQRGLPVRAVLDNNEAKQGSFCCGIPITAPEAVMEEPGGGSLVCIAARAYEAMREQLRRMGYDGEVVRLVDYNSYAEYSLSEETVERRRKRMEDGMGLKRRLEEMYPKVFKVLCPFPALGDVFLAMSYLPYFLEKRNVRKCMIGVVGDACGQVAELFCQEGQRIEVLAQKDMDILAQACLYGRDGNFYIAHQDRPYVVNLHKALYVKCIPLEQIYCCGVFGLPQNTRPLRPRTDRLSQYLAPNSVEKGNSVIFSPFAKSVPVFPAAFWSDIVKYYKDKGYSCFTNVAGKEHPLPGTLGISPDISQMQSAVEYAGTFVGIRSGLCDVIKYAKCRKIALYPDYCYCDTRWKAIEMYALEGWENIAVKDGFRWERD